MEGVLVMGIWAERNSKGSLLPKVESHQFDAKVYANRINDLGPKVDALETIIKSLTTFLLEHNVTEDEMNDCVAEALEQQKNKYKYVRYRNCDECGKRMQETKGVIFYCLYCGKVNYSHPYEVRKLEE